MIVDDRYELLEVLGKGGHGVVHRARDLSTGALVAIKSLHDSVAADPEYAIRMLREAQAMAALSGTSAVRVHEFRTSQRGKLYLVMELLQGRDFDQYLYELETRGERVSPRFLLDAFEPIVDTLEAAHERGIIHRDLKPSNIFLVEEGGEHRGVRLLDFGLCKLKSASYALTQNGMIAGSPSYIAPEVWRGDPGALDHRLDVYSLGAIAYRALTGRVPFDAPSLFEKFELVMKAERPSLHAYRPDLSEYVDDWVKQALAVDANERFQNVRALWNALRGIIGTTPSLRAPSPSGRVGS